MAISPMYPAKAGSPKTTLTANIAADATTMTLDDATVLPTAPNLCVIGEDESAEVVSYTGISGNSVTGLIRGLGGTTASVWTSGTSVARNYTSFDHDRFIENIQDLEDNKASLASPTLTGTPKAPTAATSTNTTQIASTAFVQKHAPIHLSVNASAGSTAVKADAQITSTMRVINIVFGNPANVISDVSWETANGSVTFTATFVGSTSINFDVIEVN